VISSSTASTGGAGEAGLLPDATLPVPLTPSDPATVISWPDEPTTDGRLARGQRTRRNVADGLIALLREGDPEPTARSVARRAGVSLRLVFHHFVDLDDLYAYVAALEFRRQWSDMPRLSPKLALATRIERTVAHRAALFEDISPVRRALAHRGASARDVAMALTSADALLHESLIATFAPELAAMPEVVRAEHLYGMDTVTSWEAWERMRRSSRLPAGVARRVMARTLAVLSVAPDAAPQRDAPLATGA
jgi:AcrR family transcriptional regulator